MERDDLHEPVLHRRRDSVPLILLGAIARKLIRSTPWVRDDFFLGVDLSLAGISSGLIYISDLLSLKKVAAGCTTVGCRSLLSNTDLQIERDAGFLVVALLMFLLVLALHQDDPGKTGNPRRQVLILGVLGNVIGVALLSGFILLVKGVGP